MTESTESVSAPATPAPEPPAVPPNGTILPSPETVDQARRSWIVARLVIELTLVAQMYFDRRYRISRMAKIALPLVIAALVANYFFFNVWLAVPVFSPILERLIIIALTVFTYRVLARELDRYRVVLDYLARYGSGR